MNNKTVTDSSKSCLTHSRKAYQLCGIIVKSEDELRKRTNSASKILNIVLHLLDFGLGLYFYYWKRTGNKRSLLVTSSCTALLWHISQTSLIDSMFWDKYDTCYITHMMRVEHSWWGSNWYTLAKAFISASNQRWDAISVCVPVRTPSWVFNSHHVRNVTCIILDSKHCTKM